MRRRPCRWHLALPRCQAEPHGPHGGRPPWRAGCPPARRRPRSAGPAPARPRPPPRPRMPPMTAAAGSAVSGPRRGCRSRARRSSGWERPCNRGQKAWCLPPAARTSPAPPEGYCCFPPCCPGSRRSTSLSPQRATRPRGSAPTPWQLPLRWCMPMTYPHGRGHTCRKRQRPGRHACSWQSPSTAAPSHTLIASCHKTSHPLRRCSTGRHTVGLRPGTASSGAPDCLRSRSPLQCQCH
mmetsp:Transcript_58066/g.165008  ORF Transcript_58066/g.165008 Transcript_58066/m.165008 type:complete len:238 (-) Transcript_58066:136-849(-)